MRNKLIKPQDLYIGQLVVSSTHSESQVRTVGEIYDHGSITVVWYEGTRKCGQTLDGRGWYTPTLKQIEYSIAANGQLVSTKEC